MVERGLGEVSETSPLLAGTASENVPAYMESGESAVGPLPSDNINEHNRAANGYGSNGNGVHKPRDEDEEAGLARHESAQSDRNQQFQGMPDVMKQMKYIMPAVAIGIFLAAIDQTLVASAAGTIGSDLKSLKNTSWVATAYFLTLTSFQPLYVSGFPSLSSDN